MFSISALGGGFSPAFPPQPIPFYSSFILLVSACTYSRSPELQIIASAFLQRTWFSLTGLASLLYFTAAVSVASQTGTHVDRSIRPSLPLLVQHEGPYIQVCLGCYTLSVGGEMVDFTLRGVDPTWASTSWARTGASRAVRCVHPSVQGHACSHHFIVTTMVTLAIGTRHPYQDYLNLGKLTP